MFQHDLLRLPHRPGDSGLHFQEPFVGVKVFHHDDSITTGNVGRHPEVALFADSGDFCQQLLDEGLELIPFEPVGSPAGREIGRKGSRGAKAITPDGE